MTNIVVEFGNARLQAVADRYVHGEDVPIEQVRAIWRNARASGGGACCLATRRSTGEKCIRRAATRRMPT